MKLRFLAGLSWLLGLLFVWFVSPALESFEFKSLVEGNQSSRVTFQVLSEPIEFQNFAGITDRQLEIRVQSPEFLRGKTGLVTIGAINLSKGQNVEGILTFRKSNRNDFQFKARLKHLIRSHDSQSPDLIESMRKSFSQNLRGITSDSAALVAGLAIGDDSKLSKGTKESFRAVSLTHLTAVSGANCAIVLAVLALLINRLPLRRWMRIGMSLLAVGGYLALVGPEPSVLRASVMVSIVLVGLNLGRKVNPVDALALSVVLLLVSDPKLSLDYGFALSVLATLGILVLAPKLVVILEKRLPKWLSIGLAVTIAAQIACLPILLVLQPEIPVYAVIANLLVEPLVIPITILGLLSCLLALVFPPLTAALSFIASIPASWVIAIASYLASAPYSNLPWYSGVLGVFLAVLLSLAVFVWFTVKQKLIRVTAGVTATLIVAGFIAQNSASALSQGSFYSQEHTIVNCDVGQGDALVIKSRGKVALIDVGRENPAIDKCLGGLGISRIDLLILTHFDMDHVGGILGAVTGRSIGVALVSPFPDERPGADFAEKIISAKGVEIVQAEVGMHGLLGDFQWKVLSPHRGATEAEDSNDASIGMLWESNQLALFTLADLGEDGQLRIGNEQKDMLNSGFPGKTVIVKVAHHGSADQAAELYEAIRPDVALISVGRDNSYGHPTKRTMDLLRRLGSKILRTDEHGALGLAETDSGLTASISGRS